MNPIQFQQVLDRLEQLRREAEITRLIHPHVSLRFRLAQLLISWAAWLEPNRVQVIRKTPIF